MINKTDNPVRWALLNYQLSDSLEHLEVLVNELMVSEEFDEYEFQSQLVHVYSHLNRAWNMRNLEREMTKEEFLQFAAFPKDITPN